MVSRGATEPVVANLPGRACAAMQTTAAGIGIVTAIRAERAAGGRRAAVPLVADLARVAVSTIDGATAVVRGRPAVLQQLKTNEESACRGAAVLCEADLARGTAGAAA